MKTLQEIVTEYIVKISEYTMILILALTVIVFLWGLTKFLFKASSPEARKEGRRLMFWGLLGIFVIVSVWALIDILAATIGADVAGVPQFK